MALRPPEVFIRLPHSWCGASLEGVKRVAEAAERLGYAGVSVQDHILSSRGTSPCGHHHDDDDRMVLEPLTTLSYVAARTEQLKLLTGVLVLPYRGPVWVAKMGATLDVLSGGRFVLGVGIGWPRGRTADGGQRMAQHAALAAREVEIFDPPEPRWKLMNESLEALAALWRDGEASYAGELIHFEGVDMRPLPVQRPTPPIWVGGRADAVIRRAALLADGWFPSQASVAVIRDGREQLLRIAGEQGRPTPTVAVNLFVSVDRDGAVAREIVRDGLEHRFESEERMFASSMAGSPAEIGERMREYAQAGVSAFDLKILPLQTEPTLEQVQLIAEEVLPLLA